MKKFNSFYNGYMPTPPGQCDNCYYYYYYYVVWETHHSWSLNAKPGWLAFGDPTCSKRPKQRVKVELGSVIPEVLTIPDLLRFEVWTLCEWSVVKPGYLGQVSTAYWAVEDFFVPSVFCSVVKPGYLVRSALDWVVECLCAPMSSAV